MNVIATAKIIATRTSRSPPLRIARGSIPARTSPSGAVA
jgi:hypothetical protein